jgi:hypothetical protein
MQAEELMPGRISLAPGYPLGANYRNRPFERESRISIWIQQHDRS